MKRLRVVKIGGNIIDSPPELREFLHHFAATDEPKILVHGGGKLATRLAEQLGIPQTLIDGRRVTDRQTLDIAVMVYAGLVNKNIVAMLQAARCNALGLCGADANIITTRKRMHSEVDYGFVGDVVEGGVNGKFLSQCIAQGITPVISAITHDGNGTLLNTNADTLASAIAIAMGEQFDTSLSYCFEKKGVLADPEDDNSLLPKMNRRDYQNLASKGIISKGMIPKLDNAFGALEKGVASVNICHARDIKVDSALAQPGTILV